jgi:GcrA cell cycle regulator
MQSMNWAHEHCDALREYHAKGMSYAEIAEAINAKFETVYSRNAALGRARRMGLADPDRPKSPPKSSAPQLQRIRERNTASSLQLTPVFEPVETVKLRCVEVDPRRLSLIDLEPGDCRYPYGGDAEGEAITFCGHPRRRGSSYCTAHFDLSRGPGTASERTAITDALRLVEARHEFAGSLNGFKFHHSREQSFGTATT